MPANAGALAPALVMSVLSWVFFMEQKEYENLAQ